MEAGRPLISTSRRLIDVLLVLLIIFMVITPLTPKGLEALVPQPPPPHQPETQTDRTVVVQVLLTITEKVKLKINQEDVTHGKSCRPGLLTSLRRARNG